MKVPFLVLKTQVGLLAALFLAAVAAHAQAPGAPMGGGAQFSGAMDKLFGDFKTYSATMEVQTDAGQAGVVSFSAKMASLNNMNRVDMDMSKMTNAQMPPQAMDMMKKSGMDKVTTITDKDKKMLYMLYPSLNAYVTMPIPAAAVAPPPSSFKMDVTELGAETVADHPCIKNKEVITGPDGASHEFTVWNAKDMGKFPVKIQATEGGMATTMLFKDVKLDKPDEAQFKPPPGYKKYDSMMQLMMSTQSHQGAP